MLVYGLGVGSVIISLLTILSILFCAVSLRTRSSIGPVFVLISGIVLLGLVLVPRGQDPQSAALEVMNSRVPVIVNFHADWCDPCHILTPKLRSITDASEDIHLAIVDVEANPELVHAFEVKAVPAVLAIRNGLVIDKFIGLVDGGMIDGMVSRLKGEPSQS